MRGQTVTRRELMFFIGKLNFTIAGFARAEYRPVGKSSSLVPSQRNKRPKQFESTSTTTIWLSLLANAYLLPGFVGCTKHCAQQRETEEGEWCVCVVCSEWRSVHVCDSACVVHVHVHKLYLIDAARYRTAMRTGSLKIWLRKMGHWSQPSSPLPVWAGTQKHIR